MFSERFEFFKVLTYRDTVTKYVDAMQKNKSVAPKWRQTDYFAIFVWALKQFDQQQVKLSTFLCFSQRAFTHSKYSVWRDCKHRLKNESKDV